MLNKVPGILHTLAAATERLKSEHFAGSCFEKEHTRPQHSETLETQGSCLSSGLPGTQAYVNNGPEPLEDA